MQKYPYNILEPFIQENPGEPAPKAFMIYFQLLSLH